MEARPDGESNRERGGGVLILGGLRIGDGWGEGVGRKWNKDHRCTGSENWRSVRDYN